MIKALAVVLLAAAAAGAFFFIKASPPQAKPLPIAQVQGTSFDVEVKVESTPAPAPVPAPVPEVKPEVKPEPVAVPAPAPAVPEAKPAAEAPPAKVEAKAPPVEVKPEIKPENEQPLSLTFHKLAFRYWPQTKDKGARDPFPKEIKALHGKKVVMDGFMFPIDFEKGKVRSFILSNGMFGCCFGDAPSITETIKVYRGDGKLMPYQSMARVTGTLEVGEEFDADGYVDSVYRIKADDVGATPANH